jgi:hypothetical protein
MALLPDGDRQRACLGPSLLVLAGLWIFEGRMAPAGHPAIDPGKISKKDKPEKEPARGDRGSPFSFYRC